MVLQGAENIEKVPYNPKMYHQFLDADSTSCTQEPENTFGFENTQRRMFSIGLIWKVQFFKCV